LIYQLGDDSHLYRDATEKLFLHTIYSVSNLIDMLYFVLIYTQKGLFHCMYFYKYCYICWVNKKFFR